MKSAERLATATGFDPTVIIAIITIAIELWKQCHDIKDLPGATLPRLYQRRLAKVLRQHNAPPGMQDAILHEIKTMSLEDINE